MRGTLKLSGTGTEVDYRIEFIPMMLWALVLSYAVGIPVVIAAVWLGYIPMSALVLLIAITAFGLLINLWFSERQAAWLKDYLDSVLDVRPIAV